MAVRRIDIDNKPLTIEVAREINQLPPLRGERELNPKHVQYLIEIIRRGDFNDPLWATCVIKGDADPNRVFRANGQHSSRALLNLPSDLPFPTRADGSPQNVIIERYEIDSVADAPRLFDKFDNPKSVRSNNDYLQQCKVTYPELVGIKNTLLSQLTSGVHLFVTTSRKEEQRKSFRVKPEKSQTLKNAAREKDKAVAARYRGDFYLANPRCREYVVWISQFQGAEHGSFLSRPPITSVIYGGWLQNRTIAEVFWSWVLKEDHEDPDHESRELARDLTKDMEKHKVSDTLMKTSAKVWKRYLRNSVQFQLSSQTTTRAQERPEQSSAPG